ncbi:MAG: hypothetical protein A4E34_00898 [Methanoregula sp. PtaU1.Bin006]|uniref:hypothetical protein n=1 Tax=Methanoregula sp. PtaU1.Bin006 TaxID=1811681 RepID=UPI0009D281EB|nr:hypothetical protein [Methanoregula sp. PtaU1.Bin006]OPY35221.1 MAG: hypothetical protein A4E34_00898 [Methanoregula sp. PtaU1.Bin006]
MTDLNSIPDETKWKIAAGFSATIPAMYDRAFRNEIGERYDEIEHEIWIEASVRMADIARGLALPTSTAQDLAETMRIVMTIIFGPDFRNEALEVSKDGSVIVIRRCPLISAGYDAGSDGERTFGKCMAFILAGIPRLNRNFSARFVRTMCSGDRQCEIKITKNPPAAQEPAGKK